MPDPSDQRQLAAIQAFNKARWLGALEKILANLTGKPADLFSFEEVRQAIGTGETSERELREIPLDSIVGSVGRYGDFTRSFLPRVEEDEERWARVWAQMSTMQGLPPIEVYQLGEVYFVVDGNHRVSVARQQGATHIEAYVTKVTAAVPLSPDDRPEDLIRKARYARFLEQTGLNTAVPEIDLGMSVAGNYRVLESQIRHHQRSLEAQTGHELSFAEAARRWYQEVYEPVIGFIRQRGLLRDFPDRTETDLYVWIDRHQRALAAHLGWSVDAQTAVLDLADDQAHSPQEVIERMGHKLVAALTPTALEAGPAVGEWRDSWLATYREDRLFSHILVAIDGQEAGWHALEQASRVAEREGGQIFGLHVVDTAERARSQEALALRAEFERRCREAAMPGEFTVAAGPTTGTICYRARWADLVVVSLSHPPGPQPVERLSSGFAQLLRRCPRPVLAVPRTHANLERVLLAYDGSPKANEALFVGAYLAGQWGVRLAVVVALDKAVTENTARRVRHYLDGHSVQAEYVVKRGSPAAMILNAARERGCGLILMGGYGLTPALEVVAGSVVDEVLRARSRPVLICR